MLFRGHWRKRKDDSDRADTAKAALARAIESSYAPTNATAIALQGTGTSITVPDYVEPMYGLRCFGVERSGLLVPPVYHARATHFNPYEARPAECRRIVQQDRDHMILDLMIYSYYSAYDAGRIVDTHLKKEMTRNNHPVPNENCSCGYYVASDEKKLMGKGFYPYAIIAETAMWGKIVVHEKGWRAQYIYPTSFHVVCEYFSRGMRDSYKKIGHSVEQNYGCTFKGLCRP